MTAHETGTSDVMITTSATDYFLLPSGGEG